ncbi:MAG: methyltransferase domain-containing protein [Hyphomicrobiaceae bacterium]
MLAKDNAELACSRCKADLAWQSQATVEGDDVIEGVLACTGCHATFPVRNGIARFVDGLAGYNAMWNYKWTEIDRGRGLNYRIIDPSDPAYDIHDIYDRNSHDGEAFKRMRGGRAIEIGCGVGQYVVKSLKEHAPERIFALDLTEGVDTFRAIVKERYPELLSRIVFVQASVFEMPLRPQSFDMVYSLGVLHHTGRTLDAIRAAIGLVKPGGDVNVWVYAASSYPIDTREPGREALSGFVPLLRIVYGRIHARTLYWLFSKMSPRRADAVLSLFASPTWYRICNVPLLGRLARLVLSPVPHPDADYRRLNLFDGYVNAWAENWSEHELFPLMRECDIAIKGISPWRTGIWGTKTPGFYDPSQRPTT